MTNDDRETRSFGVIFSLLHRAVVAEPFAEPPAGWQDVARAASLYGQSAGSRITPNDFDRVRGLTVEEFVLRAARESARPDAYENL